MSFAFRGREYRKIGVVGSGQIGPDIALYFTKIFHRYPVPVVVVDVVEDALERGKSKVVKKIDKGVETGAFTTEMAVGMKENLEFTLDYDKLADADLVVEAATEDLALKRKIFARLEKICPRETIFASNSSHMEPEVIFSDLKQIARSLVIHYFFPAERNPLVEIVPGGETGEDIAREMLALYEEMGKVPIRVGSRYGYAVDPVFEGLFLAAALIVEAGLGTTVEVDAVATRALGLRVGPFTAMNLTGGNPITHHGLDEMTDKIMEWFRSPRILAEKMKDGTPWDVPARGDKVEVPEDREREIADHLRGAYFGLACEIVDSGIANIADLELALEIGLDLTPPFRLMNEVGISESLALVEAYAGEQDGFKIPNVLREQAARGLPWQVPVVLREDRDSVAVLTIRRPRVLNALNDDVFAQLGDHFQNIGEDAGVSAVVLTGFGVKAFVSGADVNFLAAISSSEEGENTSLRSQAVLNQIENLGKPVVCALNGFAFGGGNELAMACTARMAKKGLKILGGQPEPNLGIIPGAGATQRLPRWIGMARAAELLRTGRTFSSREAVELGLVLREVEGDLVQESIDLALELAAGQTQVSKIPRGPIEVETPLPDLNLGHLSRKIDDLMCRAIVEGASLSLEDGLKLEAKLFGECCATRDMRIGVENFIKNGPRSKAEFVHA